MKKSRMFVLLPVLVLIFMSACSSGSKTLKAGIVLDSSAASVIHKSSFNAACEELGIKDDSEIKENIAAENCFTELTEMVKSGCNVIFTAGDEFEDYVIQAAQENPYVSFWHYGGQSHIDIRPENFHTYAIDTSQQRYIAGVVAGYKLNELYENEILPKNNLKLGYVAELPDADSISDYTAFYLGAKSVCDSVEMDVHFTGTVEDKSAELASAKVLTAAGCTLITQQSVLNAAASVCEENGVFFIGNSSLVSDDEPTYQIVCTADDYKVCYSGVLEKLISGESLPRFLVFGAKDGVPQLAKFNPDTFLTEATFNKAKTAADEANAQFAKNQLGAFNTNRFTVDGKRTETTAAEELYEIYFGVEYINKYNWFAEYEYCSVPKFSFAVDGINQLNANEFLHETSG